MTDTVSLAETRPRSKTAVSMGRYRWAVASRALAAVGGGYALAAATAAGVGLVLALKGAAA